MEGTRNERVAVLVTSYLIGFLTAYIAFGVTQLEEKIVYVPSTTQSASVIAATDAVSTAAPVVAETKEGLAVISGGEVRVVSAKVADSDVLVDDGYHVSIADYALSPDSRYVYFCEVPGETDICRPFIYDIEEDVLYPVRHQGERVAFEAKPGAAKWGSDGSLIYE